MKSKIDLLLEIASIFFLAILWIFVLYNYRSLPNEIPTHYGIGGKADAYGDKSHILALPIIATILNLFLFILNKNPQLYNLPVKITAQNKDIQYAIATRMIRVLRLSLVIIFAFISYVVISCKGMEQCSLSPTFLPMVFCLIFLPIIYFVWLSRRTEKTNFSG